jgi:predicted O-methyltransferase YrrM
MSDLDLYALRGILIDVVPVGPVVEIGVALGRSTAGMVAPALKRGMTYCAVDTFSGAGDVDDYINAAYGAGRGALIRQAFELNCRSLGIWNHIRLIEKPSVEAAREFRDGSLAMCFIDADHRYDAVMQDMVAWWPKVMPMGVMCGHDADNEAVWRAVLEFVKNEKVGMFRQANVWAIQK